LSTHLLAKHRRALDDYYLDTDERKLILKPDNWVPTIDQRAVHRSSAQTSSKDMSSMRIIDMDKSRLETADTMANLVSAAMADGSSNGLHEEAGDGLWLMKQVSHDSEIDENFDEEDSDSENDSDAIVNSTAAAAMRVSKLAMPASVPFSSLSNDHHDQAITLAERNKPGTMAASFIHDEDGNEMSGDNENKSDRRKFNRGTQQRKSYTKDTKLSVIGMRDQGKCTEEISTVMGIPKSNIEKWCSAKGREKILRDIYRDVISQRPRVFPATIRHPGGMPISDLATTSLAQQLPPPPGYQLPMLSRQNNAGSYLMGESIVNYSPAVNSHASSNASTNYRVAVPTINSNYYLNNSSNLNWTATSANATALAAAATTNHLVGTATAPSASTTTNINNSTNTTTVVTTMKRSVDSMDDASTAEKRSRPSQKKVNGAGGNRSRAVTKRKQTPLSTAQAAAAVAQSISFNNDGFSDSDDDNEVMGLLGEQLPIVALHRLTQMRP
jgi:hypothetical protein